MLWTQAAASSRKHLRIAMEKAGYIVGRMRKLIDLTCGSILCLPAMLLLPLLFCAAVHADGSTMSGPRPVYDYTLPPLRFDPWSLIVYRPVNTERLNQIRCWIRLEDEQGNDVTYTSASATYEWVTDPDIAHPYQKSYYLEGGMAMHLLLKPGVYRITVRTPQDQLPLCDDDFPYPHGQDWESNVYVHDTENPPKVIFVSPDADENGFYSGGWHIDYRAPGFHEVTKPFRKDLQLPLQQ